MSYDKFVYVIENINSDLYLIILLFLLNQKPFTEKGLATYDTNVKIQNKEIISKQFLNSHKMNYNKIIKSP